MDRRSFPTRGIRAGSWVRNAHDTRMRGIVHRIENASAWVQWSPNTEPVRAYLDSLILDDPIPPPPPDILFPLELR